jgi:hypothetical protein
VVEADAFIQTFRGAKLHVQDVHGQPIKVDDSATIPLESKNKALVDHGSNFFVAACSSRVFQACYYGFDPCPWIY